MNFRDFGPDHWRQYGDEIFWGTNHWSSAGAQRGQFMAANLPTSWMLSAVMVCVCGLWSVSSCEHFRIHWLVLVLWLWDLSSNGWAMVDIQLWDIPHPKLTYLGLAIVCLSHTLMLEEVRAEAMECLTQHGWCSQIRTRKNTLDVYVEIGL